MTRHQELVERLKAEGWLVGRWRETLEGALRDPRWWNDGNPVASGGSGQNKCIVDRVKEMNMRPDAYRFRVEGIAEGLSHDVLVIEVMEVAVTHRTPVDTWESLWFLCDAMETVELRVFQMDAGGAVEPLLVQENAVDRVHNRLAAAGKIPGA